MKSHPLHEKAKLLVGDYVRVERELISLLQEIEGQKVFSALGYASMHQYCVRGLGLSGNQTYTFVCVARRCAEVPELQAAVFDGTITTSTARRLLPVIEKQNSGEWLAKAVAMPQKQLEREVARANPDCAIPEVLKPVSKTRSEFRCGVDEETEESLRRCREVVSQKLKSPCEWNEVLKFVTQEFLRRKDPVKKADRVGESLTARQVPVAKQVGPAKPTPMSAAIAGKATRGMPSLLRHRVNQRDRGRCQFKLSNGGKCGSAYWTEMHHIKPRAFGGADTLENLITLCSAHHGQTHGGARAKYNQTITGALRDLRQGCVRL